MKTCIRGLLVGVIAALPCGNAAAETVVLVKDGAKPMTIVVGSTSVLCILARPFSHDVIVNTHNHPPVSAV